MPQTLNNVPQSHALRAISRCLVVREVLSADELIEHFKLRHDVYAHYGHLPTNEDRLDIDAWDVSSHFLAAYSVEGPAAQMVGAIRMVLPGREGPMAHVVRGLLQGARSAVLRAVGEQATALPSERAFDLNSILEAPRRLGQTVVEFSRTARLPDYRGRAFGRTLATAVHGLALTHGAALGIGCCPLNLTTFYEACGCVLLPHVGTAPYPEIGKEAMALLIPLNELPPELSRDCREAGRALTNGAWCPCGGDCAMMVDFRQSQGTGRALVTV